MSDMVNHPSHYKNLPGGIEMWDIIKHRGLAEAAAEYNVLKYTNRFHEKNGTEDLEKARWFLDELIMLRKEREKNEVAPKDDVPQAEDRDTITALINHNKKGA